MKTEEEVKKEIRLLRNQLNKDKIDNVIRTIAYDRIEALKWVLGK